MPLTNKSKFLDELKDWKEIKAVYLVDKDSLEGNAAILCLLFQKNNRVVHKFQLKELFKTLSYNETFLSGIEIARFHLKKYECHSLFQLTDNGDFIAIRYMEGLNPALYTNELAIMSKIVYSVSTTHTQS